jgi:hypothetical protein
MARNTMPGFKEFRPIAIYRHTGPSYYVNHLMTELGRLGMDKYDLTPRNSVGVLEEIIDWMDDPG